MTEKLIKIQNQLKAPKGQYNKFGNYAYRNLEDILEAVKPLLYAQGLTLTMSDEVIEVAGLPVIKAIAILSDGENEIVRTAVAGVDVNQKGMAIAQAFGSSSSYARKYLLNGIFLIDDTKDDDATNKHGKTAPASPKVKETLTANSAAYLKVIQAIKDGYDMKAVEEKYNVSTEVKKSIAEALAK